MKPLLNPLRPNSTRRHVHWHQLHGSASALALAECMDNDSRLYVVVTAGAREMERLAAEIAFFQSGQRASQGLMPLPDWEILPYDLFSPHPDITSRRLQTLFELPAARGGCLILAADTLLQRLPPVAFVQGRAFDLSVGQTLSVEPFRQRLADAGYASVGQVTAPGEFAVRGSLLDVFPMGAATPLRIDLFGTEIEAIRRFDPESQRSLDSVATVRMLPAREVPLDAESIKGFRRRYRTRFEGDPMRSSVYRAVTEGLAPPGIEFYLPLFFEGTASLFDYLPRDAVIVHDSGAGQALQQLWSDIENRYEERRHDIERPILAPHELFLTAQELAKAAEPLTSITLDSFKADLELHPEADTVNYPTVNPPELRIDARATEPLAPLAAFLAGFDGRVLITADSPGRREVLQDMLRPHTTSVTAVPDWATFAAGEARLALTVAPDIGGLQLQTPRVALLSESQLFGARASQERRRRRSASDPAAILRDLTDLNPGSPVVHEEYGVGRYVGLLVMEVAGTPGEFLVLEYHGGDRIYVPVHALHLISRYTGSAPEHAPLHKLGTEQWAKAKKRAAEQVRDIAAELLDLYARRRAQHAASLPLREVEYQAFANAFPFEETEDQADAIAKVLEDLAKTQAMDRIVCGDVGLRQDRRSRAGRLRRRAGRPPGRGALAPSDAARQQQHLGTFRDRFADWPVRSSRRCQRFRTARESETVIEGIEEWQGRQCHRHPSAAARERALSRAGPHHHRWRSTLRFGVRKTRRNAPRRCVPAYVLDAFSRDPYVHPAHLEHGTRRPARPVADHHTPPPGRLTIKTFVSEWHDATIREAVMRELRRAVARLAFLSTTKSASDIDKIGWRSCGSRSRRPTCASACMARCASGSWSS